MNRWKLFSLAGAIALSGFLYYQDRGERRNLEGEGIVFIYYASECAAPGDATDCKVIPGDKLAFKSMPACNAHALKELNAAHDPKRMATCEKLREG